MPFLPWDLPKVGKQEILRGVVRIRIYDFEYNIVRGHFLFENFNSCHRLRYPKHMVILASFDVHDHVLRDLGYRKPAQDDLLHKITGLIEQVQKW